MEIKMKMEDDIKSVIEIAGEYLPLLEKFNGMNTQTVF